MADDNTPMTPENSNTPAPDQTPDSPHPIDMRGSESDTGLQSQVHPVDMTVPSQPAPVEQVEQVQTQEQPTPPPTTEAAVVSNTEPTQPAKPATSVLSKLTPDTVRKLLFVNGGLLVLAFLVFVLQQMLPNIIFSILLHLLFIGILLSSLTYTFVSFKQFLQEKQNPGKEFPKVQLNAILAGAVVVIAAILWPILSALQAPAITQGTPTLTGGSAIVVRQKDERTGGWIDLQNLSNVSAPVELQFDSRFNLPPQTPEYRIIGYEWDVNGDGNFSMEEGKEAVATYMYTDRGINNGVVNVSLRVTKEILMPHANYKNAGEVVNETYGPGTDKGGVSFTITSVRPYIDVITTPQELSGVIPFKVDFDATRTRAGSQMDEITWDFTGDLVPDDRGTKVSYTFNRPGFHVVTVEAIDVNGLSSRKTLEVEVTDALLPEPVIEADVLSGDAPLTVSFDGGKSEAPEGRIVEYNWNFGDDSPVEKGQTIQHTFTRAGRFTVTLEVKTDTNQSAQITEVVTVSTSKSAPTARMQARGTGGDGKSATATQKGQLQGKIPFVVAFDGTFSTDPERDIVEWKWDFDGNGTIDSTGEKVEHTYRNPGTYTVKLEVTDSAKNTSSETMTVKVDADEFVADIFADPVSAVAPAFVAFDASGSSYANGQIVSYTWDFGDGGRPQITGARVSHEYTTPGEYIIQVKVSTSDGKSKTAQKNISILQKQLVPSFTMTPKTGNSPIDISFDASASTGDIVSYRWDFGNGRQATGPTTKQTFTAPGKYMVELRIQDKYGSQQRLTQELTINSSN